MAHKILIVLHDYPPITSARAIRWSSIAEYWAAQGDHVDIVSSWQADDVHTQKLNNVNVYRVNSVWLQQLRSWFKKSRPGPNDTGANPQNLPKLSWSRKVIFRMAYRIYHDVYRNLYWPDGAMPWYGAAFQQAEKLMRENDYNILISASPYFTSHVVCLRLSRIFKDRL